MGSERGCLLLPSMATAVAEDAEEEGDAKEKEEKVFPADSPMPLSALQGRSHYSAWVWASNALGTACSAPWHLNLKELGMSIHPSIHLSVSCAVRHAGVGGTAPKCCWTCQPPDPGFPGSPHSGARSAPGHRCRDDRDITSHHHHPLEEANAAGERELRGATQSRKRPGMACEMAQDPLKHPPAQNHMRELPPS